MKTISKVITLDNRESNNGEYLAQSQIIFAETIVDKLGYDITTCGHCGEINIINVAEEDQKCYSCGYEGEPCEFPSLFFSGMTIIKRIE